MSNLFKISYLVFLSFFLIALKLLLGQSGGVFLSFRAIFIYLWLMFIWLFSLSGRATLVVGLVFLLSLPPFFFFRGDGGIEMPATLSFVFLALGVVQLSVEILRGKSDDDT